MFTGRTFEVSVFPFSFAEYMRHFGYTDSYSAFEKYLTEGGMSGSYLYKDSDAKFNYLSDVFGTLIVRDIRQKY